MNKEIPYNNGDKLEVKSHSNEDSVEIKVISSKIRNQEMPLNNVLNKVEIELPVKEGITSADEIENINPNLSTNENKWPKSSSIELGGINDNEDIKYTKQKDLELVWKDIKMSVKDKKTKKEVFILNGVSGRIKSGECLAIIGASGAGKTTLLNFLSKKISAKKLKIQGEYTMNGRPIHTNLFNALSAYVMQDDILEPTLTPLEILMFTAKLKLHLPQKEIEERVQKMIADLHLKRCQHTRVGSVLKRGVSGGERKRTSIGVELISDTKIIFLDEPTTGLDAYNAFEVVRILRTLASQGKLVIFTIHQPSSEVFHLLDKLFILALGRTVYFGPQEKSSDFFASVNIPVPPMYNPFEHFIEMTNITTIQNPKILSLYPELEKYENNQEKYAEYIKIIADKYDADKDKYFDNSFLLDTFSDDLNMYIKEKKKRKSFCYEMCMLLGRTTLINMRDLQVLLLRILQNAFIALFLAAVYTPLGQGYASIQDRSGLLLIIMATTIFGSVTSTIFIFPDERKVFTRERANQLYRVSAYYISRVFGEFSVFFIATFIMGVIVYFSTFLNDTFSYKYWIFCSVILLGCLWGVSYAFFLGNLTTNKEILININSLATVCLFLLSGFFNNSQTYAPYLIPFEYISEFKYIFQSLMVNEFTDMQPLYCYNLNSNGMCRPLESRFKFDQPFYTYFIALLALLIGFKILGFILLYYLARIKV